MDENTQAGALYSGTEADAAKDGTADMADGFEPDLSASEAPARTTMGGTVLVGPRDADRGDYAQLVAGPPEPHVIRHLDPGDLSQTAPVVTFALTAFAQITDLHIVDDQSPLRVEYLDRYADPGEPHLRSYEFDSAYRPQECMAPFLTDAICRAVRKAGRGPRTGLPLAFTMVSGDGIDNCQANELRWYIDILDGQTVTTNSGSPSLDHSVTSDALGLAVEYWHPASFDFEESNHNGPGLDNYFRAGYPAVAQLPFIARKPFAATGLGMAWFACYGNHDALVQGNLPPGFSIPGLDLGAIAEGGFKSTQLLQPLPDVQGNVGLFDLVGQMFGIGNCPGLDVPADPRRQLASRADFIAEHFTTQGTPVGHGFALGDAAFYVVPGRPGDGYGISFSTPATRPAWTAATSAATSSSGWRTSCWPAAGTSSPMPTFPPSSSSQACRTCYSSSTPTTRSGLAVRAAWPWSVCCCGTPTSS
jgi:hypothetical protein